eukprot:TRINITY_DN5874_c0_g1_i2.p1 TRINITY_DN5874_c0_g1~~TRINITY_DN5874_c0_g1_i2.p1  ORF type:complete len:398 (-),score=114.31 TRINITY_DN5874_c0_g1_i2:200-1393(-)
MVTIGPSGGDMALVESTACAASTDCHASFARAPVPLDLSDVSDVFDLDADESFSFDAVLYDDGGRISPTMDTSEVAVDLIFKEMWHCKDSLEDAKHENAIAATADVNTHVGGDGDEGRGVQYLRSTDLDRVSFSPIRTRKGRRGGRGGGSDDEDDDDDDDEDEKGGSRDEGWIGSASVSEDTTIGGMSLARRLDALTTQDRKRKGHRDEGTTVVVDGSGSDCEDDESDDDDVGGGDAVEEVVVRRNDGGGGDGMCNVRGEGWGGGDMARVEFGAVDEEDVMFMIDGDSGGAGRGVAGRAGGGGGRGDGGGGGGGGRGGRPCARSSPSGVKKPVTPSKLRQPRRLSFGPRAQSRSTTTATIAATSPKKQILSPGKRAPRSLAPSSPTSSPTWEGSSKP